MATIENVTAVPVRIEPGCKVLVKVHRDLTRDELASIKRTVQKWAGRDVDVLVVNALTTDLEVLRHG